MPAARHTAVLKIYPHNPQPEVIRHAADVIKRGGLVAFPTETVYGLGADAMNANAVARVFEAKRRPPDAPLIVLVADRAGLEALAASIPPIADKLISRFWPGPLTLTFPASRSVPEIVTAGKQAVSVRMPGSAIALALVKASGAPIVAPSANLSGHASPTSARHVVTDLDGRIDLVLDAGSTGTGIESTILDTCHTPPVLIRAGAVPIEDIEAVIGKVDMPEAAASHYSPKARLVIVETGDEQAIVDLLGTHEKVALVTRSPELYAADRRLTIRKMPSELQDYARELFGALRELEQAGFDCIAVEGVEERGIGAAIMDRLRQAARHNV